MTGLAPDLFPFRGQFFLNHGQRQHYLDEGTGHPIVMVHGNPTWSFYFRNLVSAFRESHRIIVPDHIGCGLSDKPTQADYDFSLDRRIDDLERLLDHAGVHENITLVLHDWGGMIGMGFATRHPDRIRRIIALNTAAFRLPQTKRFPWLLWLGRNTRLGAWLILRMNAFCRLAALVGTKRRRLPREVRDAYLAPYDSPAHRLAVLRFVQTIPLQPQDPGYATIVGIEQNLARFKGIPMLLCWGLKDFVFDHHFLTEWRRRFPEAEVREFPDCGHYILEDAAMEVAEAIREFLLLHPLGPIHVRAMTP